MIGMDTDDLCEDCRGELIRSRIGPAPVPKGIDVQGMAFGYPYKGPAGAMVRALKYGSARVIAPEMSGDLAAAVERLRIAHLDLVTYVPMHPVRQRKRGFNHAELLAKGMAERLGVPCECTLKRTRNAKQQARLTKEERRENLKGSFEAVHTLEGMNVLIVDDVMTTGTTVKYCAEALRKAGAAQIYFAAYARSLENR